MMKIVLWGLLSASLTACVEDPAPARDQEKPHDLSVDARSQDARVQDLGQADQQIDMYYYRDAQTYTAPHPVSLDADTDSGSNADAFTVTESQPCSAACRVFLHCASDVSCPAVDDSRSRAWADLSEFCNDTCSDGALDPALLLNGETCAAIITAGREAVEALDQICRGEDPLPRDMGMTDDADVSHARLCSDACWALDGCIEHPACGGSRDDRVPALGACIDQCNAEVVNAQAMVDAPACPGVVEAIRPSADLRQFCPAL